LRALGQRNNVFKAITSRRGQPDIDFETYAKTKFKRCRRARHTGAIPVRRRAPTQSIKAVTGEYFQI